jgi:ribosomal protein L37E
MDMSYQCSKCNSDTEEGFLLDKGDGGFASSGDWVAGKPEKSFFSGVKLKGKVAYDVKTFRCIACGYLDSYALRKQ